MIFVVLLYGGGVEGNFKEGRLFYSAVQLIEGVEHVGGAGGSPAGGGDVPIYEGFEQSVVKLRDRSSEVLFTDFVEIFPRNARRAVVAGIFTKGGEEGKDRNLLVREARLALIIWVGIYNIQKFGAEIVVVFFRKGVHGKELALGGDRRTDGDP